MKLWKLLIGVGAGTYAASMIHAAPAAPLTESYLSFFLGCAASMIHAAPAAPQAEPAPGPAAPGGRALSAADDVGALVKQLGDDDFRKREAASRRLRTIGLPALPALREATASTDAEVRSRADALLHRLKPRRPVPGMGPARPGVGGMRTKLSVVNGAKFIEVDENGRRRVRIREGPDGIKLTITGVDRGREVTEEYEAASARELRENEPEAYEVYERCSRTGPVGPDVMLNGRGGLRHLPIAPLVPPRAGGDKLDVLEQQIRRQMDDAGLPAEQRRKVNAMLRNLQETQLDAAQAAPFDDPAEPIARYNGLSDRLREALKELNLPDPGDALPPPARARLGVSVNAPVDDDDDPLPPGAAGGVVVARVLPDSRAEKMGLKERDKIRQINGKPVTSAATLRRLVTEGDGVLVIDVVRGGAELRLKEEQPKVQGAKETDTHSP